jgi:hypothetical protein
MTRATAHAGRHRFGLGTGVGLRLPHLAEVVATRPPANWLEIHPENFLANPHATELLLSVRQHYDLSIHTVGISIGSADGFDRAHLARLRSLVDAVDPVLVSGHLAWSSQGGAYLNDLLPLPFDDETLQVVVSHLHQVQDTLGRRYLIENPSSYVGFGTSTMTEAQFLSELVARTGCRLLCDVSNVYLSAHNMGYDPREYLDGLPCGAIDELHLGGFSVDDDARDELPLLVDTHAASITPPVWALYAHAVRRFGPTPTLIEWDNDLPSFATLLDEASRADSIAHAQGVFVDVSA